MKAPRHIVIGTDLSEASHYAVHRGAALAKEFGARVTLLSVYDPDPYVIADLDPSIIDMAPSLAKDVESSVLSSLNELKEKLFQGSENVEAAVVSHRSPGTAIANFTAEVNADLVVVGSHGRTGLRRALLGSVAEKVVRLAPCDVYVARTPSAPSA